MTDSVRSTARTGAKKAATPKTAPKKAAAAKTATPRSGGRQRAAPPQGAAKPGRKASRAAQAAAVPAAEPPKLSRQRPPADMALHDWQAALRRDYGRQQSFEWHKLGSEPWFTDYEVHNPQSGGRYRVTIRGADAGLNRCTCPDFTTNELGTCKHVEFLLARLQARRGAKAAFAQGAQAVGSEVLVQHGAQRKLAWRPGSDCPAALQAKAAALLDADGHLPLDDDQALPALAELAAELGHELRICDDVWAQVAASRDARWRVHRLEQLYPQGPASPALRELLALPLLPYQAEGALFAACAGRSLIADEMGLGKTVQGIAAAELFVRHFGAERVLVVCPTSLKYQWQREFQRFARRDSVVVQGAPAARRTQYAQGAPIKIVHYESLLRDLQLIQAFEPDVVIVDEAQRIKNWNTQAARALKRIASPHAVVLTGTPLENRLEELMSIVQFIDLHRLGPTWRFLHQHQQRDQAGRVTGYQGLDRIGQTLEHAMIRRRKHEVLQQLPERIDDTRLLPMTPQQRVLHDDFAAAVSRIVLRWRRTGYLSDADQRRLMSLLQQMRMVCNSTYLLDPAGGDHGTKLDELEQLLGELLEDEQAKVVVFSQWLRSHELIERRLAAAGVGCARFSGEVSAEQRGVIVQRFHDDPLCRVLLSTDAGSTGLNLQHAAAVVVNFDLPWNPAVLEQRVGRVHRMGQSRGVQVFNLVAQASIEEGMLGTLAFKRDLAAGILDGGAGEVFLQGTRLTRFMEAVEQAAGVAHQAVAEVAEVRTAEPSAGPADDDRFAAADEAADAASTPLAPVASAAPVALDWQPLLGAAASWLQALSHEPTATPRWLTDTGSGQSGLFVPMPGDAAVRAQLAGALAGLAAVLRAA